MFSLRVILDLDVAGGLKLSTKRAVNQPFFLLNIHNV